MRKKLILISILICLSLLLISCKPGEIGPGKAIAGVAVASPDVPRHPIYRCFVGSNHWLSLEASCRTSGMAAQGMEGIIGYAWDYQVPGSRPLYNHYRISASSSAYRDDFVSFDPGCEGQKCGEFLGWVPASAVPGSKNAYRCTMGFDHFVSSDSGCEGQNKEYQFFMLANDLPIANAAKFNKIRNCQNRYGATPVNILSTQDCSKSGGWPDPIEPFIASLFKDPVTGSEKITQCYREAGDNPTVKDFFIVTGPDCPAGTTKHNTVALTNLGNALKSQSAGTVAVHRLWDAYALSRTPPVMDRIKDQVFNHRASLNPSQHQSSKDEGVFGYWIKDPNNQFIQGLLTAPSTAISPPPKLPTVLTCDQVRGQCDQNVNAAKTGCREEAEKLMKDCKDKENQLEELMKFIERMQNEFRESAPKNMITGGAVASSLGGQTWGATITKLWQCNTGATPMRITPLPFNRLDYQCHTAYGEKLDPYDAEPGFMITPAYALQINVDTYSIVQCSRTVGATGASWGELRYAVDQCPAGWIQDRVISNSLKQQAQGTSEAFLCSNAPANYANYFISTDPNCRKNNADRAAYNRIDSLGFWPQSTSWTFATAAAPTPPPTPTPTPTPIVTLPSPPTPTTKPVYRCYLNNHGVIDHFLSFNSNCDGQAVDGLFGYVYKDQKPNTRAVYQCTRSVRTGGRTYHDHFLSYDANCEGTNRLGYLPKEETPETVKAYLCQAEGDVRHDNRFDHMFSKDITCETSAYRNLGTVFNFLTIAAPTGALPAPTCTDSIKNQDEADVDCGGTVCPKCGLNKKCAENTDCTSDYCENRVCKTKPLVPCSEAEIAQINQECDTQITAAKQRCEDEYLSEAQRKCAKINKEYDRLMAIVNSLKTLLE